MALAVGDLLNNKYEILKYLGRGSKGDVYLAKDRLLARKVAIKHLRPGSVDEQADVEHFLAEARTIARIRDPNVVAIYDAIEEQVQGNYYLVMEYADEGTVADLLRREGKLPVLQALGMGLAAAHALEVVHRQGILHGDVKPSNILLVRAQEGVEAKLADFGLSRTMAEAGAERDTYFGSILYSAPEQFNGAAVDRRADLYALGAVLYEMLTGRPPFPYTGKSEEMDQVIQGHLKEKPTPPSQLNPNVSPAVDEAILKALRKSPDERYQDARTLGRALRQAMATHRDWQERVETAYAQGLEHERERKWEQALACYEIVLAEQPGHPDIQRRWEQAMEALKCERLYRQALEVYAQGDWGQAEVLLSQVIARDEGYANGEAAAKLEEARRQRELDRLYQEARDYEAAESWSKTVELYLKILTLQSDYRDVPARLAEAIKQQRRQRLYDQAKTHMAAEAWTEAVQALQELEHQGPAYKDSATLLAEAQRRERLLKLYTQATQALEDGQWTSAVQTFDQILELEPTYQDAAVKRAIAGHQARLARLYAQAQAQMRASEWAAAATTLQEVQEIAPSYQDVEDLLREALEKRRAEDLFQAGMQLYEQGKWEQAIQRLEQVQQPLSDYRDVEQVLQKARNAQRIQTLYAEARQFEVERAWTRAIRAYSQILEMDASHRDARVGLARVSAASLGRQQPSVVENRERDLAIFGALLVVVALSCMLFQPLSGVAETVFATPTSTQKYVIAKATPSPEKAIAALIAVPGEWATIAEAAAATAGVETARTAAGLQATADAATATAVTEATANADATATAHAASATAVALATAKAEATETADATITSDCCWEDNFDNNSINSGCWITTVASTDPPTGLTVEDGRVRVTRALSYTSSWTPSSSLQSRQWVDINHPNTFAEWKTTIHGDSSWAILKMHLIDPDHRRALTIDCSDSDSAENFDCALVMWDTTPRPNGWRPLQSYGGMSFTLDKDYVFKLARNDTDRHVDLYVDGELKKSVDFYTAVWGNMDRVYVRWGVHHWDSSRCTYSATYPCGQPSQIDISLDHITFGTPQIESVYSLPVPNSNTLLAGTPFTKSWRIETGSYPWPQGYRLVHKSGSRLGGKEQELPKLTGVHTITLPLVAPDEPQDYTSCWTITDAAGKTISKTLLLCAEISVCVPQVEFVDHWTLPSGIRFSPEVPFTANWLLRNPSDCPWPTGSRLVFVSGNQMSGPDEVEIEELPAFSEMITVSVELVAPAAEGYYEGEWQIQSSEDTRIGEPFSVSINVAAPPLPPPIYEPPVLGGIDIICPNVTFQWGWPGTLAEDEWFAVRVGKVGIEPVHSRAWTKDRRFIYALTTPPLCGDGEYAWKIVICRGTPDAGICQELAVSEQSSFSLAGCPCLPR